MDEPGRDPAADLMVDGNAVAGTLMGVFGEEVTTMPGQCAHCGTVNMIGGLHAYVRGPGIVLRHQGSRTGRGHVCRRAGHALPALPSDDRHRRLGDPPVREWGRSSSGCSLTRRQAEPESRQPGVRFRSDLTTRGLDDLAHDREPDARSTPAGVA